MKKTWRHDELLRDLAEHLHSPERMLWMDMQLGPSGSPRPDVYTMNRSYAKPRPITYEIKVSVSDFRSDITKGKWQSYLEFSSGVYFCVPAGLISKADLPNGCGLMVRGDEGWRAFKAPTLQAVSLSSNVYMKLLIDGCRRQNILNREEKINTYLKNQEIRKNLGDAVADAITNREMMLDKARVELQSAQQKADALKTRAEKLYESELERSKGILSGHQKAIDKLREVLGLSAHFNDWQVLKAAEEFKEIQLADTRLTDAARHLRNSLRSVEFALKEISIPADEVQKNRFAVNN